MVHPIVVGGVALARDPRHMAHRNPIRDKGYQWCMSQPGLVNGLERVFQAWRLVKTCVAGSNLRKLDMLEAKIHRWICAAYGAARDFFATKSCLFFHSFHNLLILVLPSSLPQCLPHMTTLLQGRQWCLVAAFRCHSLEKLFYVFLRTRLQERVM